ncbi:MAG: hypothetical protein Gyms2KO_32970 [Gymnodinialimonas sp.]
MDLTGASFRNAVAEQADFSGTRLYDVDFSGAEASHADFGRANLHSANFVQAQLLGADFSYAYMPAVNLDRANLSNARFSYAYIAGEQLMQSLNLFNGTINGMAWGQQQNLEPTIELNISGTEFRYSAIRNYDLSEATFDEDTNLRDAFLDGSVRLPDGLLIPPLPCHWLQAPANDDAEFFGRWRGFIESRSRGAFAPSWDSIAPEEWWQVPAIRPSDC